MHHVYDEHYSSKCRDQMKAVSFPNKNLIELINKEGFVFVGDEKGKSLLLNPIENSAIHIL